MPFDKRFGIEPIPLQQHGERPTYFIIELATGLRMPDPEIVGRVMSYDTLHEAEAKCAELNRAATKVTDQLRSPERDRRPGGQRK